MVDYNVYRSNPRVQCYYSLVIQIYNQNTYHHHHYLECYLNALVIDDDYRISYNIHNGKRMVLTA